MGKYTTAEEALKVIKSNDYVYVHGGAAVPSHLVEALTARAHATRGNLVCRLLLELIISRTMVTCIFCP